jgi:hypothetical protein
LTTRPGADAVEQRLRELGLAAEGYGEAIGLVRGEVGGLDELGGRPRRVVVARQLIRRHAPREHETEASEIRLATAARVAARDGREKVAPQRRRACRFEVVDEDDDRRCRVGVHPPPQKVDQGMLGGVRGARAPPGFDDGTAELELGGDALGDSAEPALGRCAGLLDELAPIDGGDERAGPPRRVCGMQHNQPTTRRK